MAPNDQVSVRLKGLAFGSQAGVTRVENEEDGVVSIDYSIEATAVATFQVGGGMLDAPFEFSLKVGLGDGGEDEAVGRARSEVRRFLAALGAADPGTSDAARRNALI